MKDPWSRYMETATQVTRDTAERIARSFWKQGGAATENAQDLVDGLLGRSQENREAIAELVRTEMKRVMNAMGLATRDDIERLEREIAELRRRLTGGEAAESLKAESASATREAAKKTAARRTTKKADGGDRPAASTTTPETARHVETTPEATRIAAERTVPPGEASGAGEAPPIPEPTVVDPQAREQEGDG